MEKSGLLLYFCCLLLTTVKADIQLESVYELWGLSEDVEISGYNFTYIIEQTYYIDLWSQKETTLVPSAACSNKSSVVQTTNFSTYCIQSQNGNFLNEINPESATVIQQFQMPGNTTGQLFIQDNLIILTSPSSKEFSASIFNTNTGKFFCQISSIPIQEEITSVATNGDFLILGQKNVLLYISCNEGTVLTSNMTSNIGQIFAFNSSSFFVVESAEKNSIYKYFTPVYFDLTGTAIFGPFLNGSVLGASQYDDSQLLVQTHFTYLTVFFGKFYVNSTLNFALSKTIDTGISSHFDPLTYIRGESSLLFSTNSLNILYNLSTEKIAQVWSQNPPIILSNGTILNFTGIIDSAFQGILSQQPGHDPVFIEFPFSYMYQSPDFNSFWFFYNPAYRRSTGYNECSITLVQPNTSTVQTFKMKTCSCYDEISAPPIIVVYNVSLSENGIPTVVYICSDGLPRAIIANTTHEIFKEKIHGYPVLSYNENAQTLSILLFNADLLQFDVDVYNITSKKKIQSTNFPALNYGVATLMQGGHFITATSKGDETQIQIYDVNAQKVVMTIPAPVKLLSNIIFNNNLFAIGVNPENFTSFEAIVFVPIDKGYVIDTSGNTTPIPGFNYGPYFSVTPISNNSFFYTDADGSQGAFHNIFYEIPSW